VSPIAHDTTIRAETMRESVRPCPYDAADDAG
jgi:hypothetical protein